MTDFDVAVVGSGVAGLAASLQAADTGASVLLIEGGDVIGGSSRLSSGVVMAAGTRYQEAAGIADSADALYSFYMSSNHWKVEPPVVRALADECGPMVEWLGDLGVKFWDQIYFSGDEPEARGHVAIGEGQAIVDTLYAEVRRRADIEVALGRRIDRLVVVDGRVGGVAVGSGPGADVLTAGAVVLATGGFGANDGLLDELIPDIRAHSGDFFWYVGADTAQGDVFGLVQPLNGQILGHGRAQLTLRPDFAHVPDAYLPGWLVLVNADGRRFFNEMSPYSTTQPIMLAQPQPVYAVFDEAAKKAAQPKTSAASKKVNIPGAVWEDWVEPSIDEMHAKGKVLKSDTVEGLAEAMGVPPANLAGSLDRYNRDVAAGADSLYLKDPSVLRPVATGPFYAVEVRLCQAGLTSVGVRIGPDAAVLDTGTAPIPGLYAAGECTGGVLGDIYMGSGNSLCNCLSFGRIAGRSAAAAAAAAAAAKEGSEVRRGTRAP